MSRSLHPATRLPLARAFRLLGYGAPYRKGWTIIAVLTLATSAVALAAPWPVKLLIDRVLTAGDSLGQWPPTLSVLLLAAAGVVIYLIASALDALLTMAWVRVGQRMVYDLSIELFDRVQRRSLLFHTHSTVGDLLARITGDSFCVYTIVDMLLLAPVRAVLTAIFVCAVMFSLDWKLTLVSLAVAPMMAGSSYWLAPPIRVAAQRRREVESRLLAHVQQTLSGLPVVRAFGQEQREAERFREYADAAVGAQKRSILATQFHELGIGIIGAMGTALVLWIGIRHVLLGQLTLGGVLVFLAYLGTLQHSARALFGVYAGVQGIGASVDRVTELLDAPPEVEDAPDASAITRCTGAIRFHNVSFGYDEATEVLREIDLEIPAGKCVALVGASGAGKSTLAGMVMRFFDPSRGRVTLDGLDLRRIRLADLRRQSAIVQQEPLLLPMSIAANIAYARPDASEDYIRAAAKAAGADDFIRELPEGYQTVLGERGANLSVGQKQRLCIARAFLADAPILVLDEPTASLDARSENDLLDALHALSRGRTTIVIAHRLSTVRFADRIVVLDRGRIVEQGTHEDLLFRGGAYAALHARQSHATRTPAPVGA